jgi:diguanylate cyclase (GGDEF)-like protein
MISLKKYLDSHERAYTSPEEDGGQMLAAAMSAYRSALAGVGDCSLVVCPGIGSELKQHLEELRSRVSCAMTCHALSATEDGVTKQLQGWGRKVAGHNQKQTAEVKELLITMARTAESVGIRDQRCAGQFNEVTTRLKKIASLDNLTEIRASIERSAVELKSSIDRMTREGKIAVEQLREQVSTYQVKLEEAEKIAFRDALTGLSNRLYIENLLERRVAAGAAFCVAIADIDSFKQVNDQHGHMIGDELLKQFAGELTSACRSTDVVGRWGGDEFIILFDGGLAQANTQRERLEKWVCGNYTIPSSSGEIKLRVHASIGMAEHAPGEPMTELLARADGATYKRKSESRDLTQAR